MNRRILFLGVRLALLVTLLYSIGIAAAAPPAAANRQTTRGTPYTIRTGDSWSVIANMFGVDAGRLIDYNGLRSRPNLIYVGEVIYIPITVGFTPSYVNPFFYIVQSGDTLESLIARFEIDETALLVANGLSASSSVIAAGDVLLIPAGPHRVVTTTESVADVAARYHTTVDRLLEFNPHIVGATTVVPGTYIYVPIQFNAPFYAATDLASGTTTTTTATTTTTTTTATTSTTPQSIIPSASAGTQVSDMITVTDSATLYTIQRGDTWPAIERKFGVDATTLIDHNGLRDRPDLIYAGEIIEIPFALGYTPSYVNPFLYVVQSGDTVQTLINVFEIDKTSLLSTNGFSTSLDNNTPLTVGETLLIPAGPHRTMIQTGETLADVAARYSTTTNNLLQFNSHLSTAAVPGSYVYIPTQLNAPFVAATGLAEGIGGGGDGATTTTTTTATIADPGGTLTIRWVALRSVRLDPDFGTAEGRMIVRLALTFRGGQWPFTLLHEGVETPYEGPWVNVDNNVEYTDIDFEIKTPCGGSIVAAVELRSSDGQTATHTYFISDITCTP